MTVNQRQIKIDSGFKTDYQSKVNTQYYFNPEQAVGLGSTAGVGIGTTANGYKLHAIGNVNVVGIVTATKFKGDGSELENLSTDSLWEPIGSGTSAGYAPT